MEESYLKVVSVKFSNNGNLSQAKEILHIFNSMTEEMVTRFNFHSLSTIFDKDFLKYLIELLLNEQSNAFNLSKTVYLCSQYDFIDSITNGLIISKLIEIITCMENGDTVFKCLQAISITYPLLMKKIIASNMLQTICSLHSNFEIQTYEKLIFLMIQELPNVDINSLTILKKLSNEIDGTDDLFLKLISAVSVTASVEETVLTSDILWNLILSNLTSPRTIDRKRSMYWLNRTLHTCKINGLFSLNVQISNETLFLELQEDIIDNILILVDTLEEKQTHLILPVLYKIDHLKVFFTEKRLSIQWLLTIIERASLHESTIILKWALTEFLSLPIQLSSSSYYRILSTSFVKTINQSNLYFSPNSISNDRGFFASDYLDTFLNRLFNDAIEFMYIEQIEHFLEVISIFSWNSHALLFVAESFSKVTLSEKSFSFDILTKIGLLCRNNLVTLNLKYRQCIASFFLTGFFRNHRIIADRIMDYVNVLYLNFTLSETVLSDQILMKLLVHDFDSLPNSELEQIFFTVTNAIYDLKVNNINFLSSNNRLSCLALIVVLITNKFGTEHISTLINKLSEPVHQSYLNPYAVTFDILKCIICLKELHLVSALVTKNPEFRSKISATISKNLVEITKFLSFKIENSHRHDENEVDCLPLFRYFVKTFPEMSIKLYFLESSQSSAFKTIIATSLNKTVDSICGDLDVGYLLHKNGLVNTNSIHYESLNCLARYLPYYNDCFKSLTQITNLVDHVSELVDVTVFYKHIISLINLVSAIIDNFLTSEYSMPIIAIVSCLWSCILEHNSNAQIFWKLYSVFLSKIVTKLLITYNESHQDEVRECLTTIVDAIFKIGENKFGMVHLFGETVHDFFVKSSVNVHSENSDFFIDLIGRLVLYGPCHRRGLRFENRIERYLNARYGVRWDSYRINKTAESGERVGGLLILCLKKTFSVEFRERMILYLRNKDREIASNNSKCYKNYANNHIHRTRHRLYSALLVVLDSFVSSLSDECLHIVTEWMRDSIQYESLISIRHLSEWVYTILCCHDPRTQADLLAAIKATGDSKPAYVCSLITICRHIVVNCRSLVNELVLAILPLGSAQNYNIRLYAMSFITVVQQSNLIHSSDQQLVAIVNGYVQFFDRSTTIKNVKKLVTNFWWAKFDPIEDICLETIFTVLPNLFDLVEEEVITLDQFFSVADNTTELYGVRFGSCRAVWNETKDSVWRVKPEMSSVDDVECSNQIGDVQKKIQPWISCRPDEEMLRELYGSVMEASDLVLVCSLIDKATNIGGLARTSNIFGVGEFVVGNLRIIDDNSFKQLAVTADKWINMTEVAIKALTHFIAVKRIEGYEIVGIEQTANSVSLQSMVFKKKTLLLLGNEKEGIPADLISHMDKCIQIPQLGQIRSLNVHVSGAIVLWEYMKQIKLSSS